MPLPRELVERDRLVADAFAGGIADGVRDGRAHAVLNRRLAARDFIAGDYSIADMASYPWIVPHARQGQKLEDFSNLKCWFETVGKRPAVQRAYALAKDINTRPIVS